MRKGITPVISIILLLLITVALAGVAWSFLSGFIFPQITKTFTIPRGGAFCTNGLIKVNVLNTGYQSDLVPNTDFIIGEVDGKTLASAVFGSNTISPGKSGGIFQNGSTNGIHCEEGGSPGTCSSGFHTVTIGTNSQTEHISIFCP